MSSDDIKVKSLKKSLDILNCFAQKQAWGVTELSTRLGLNKSNVHDILTTFTAMGYLDREEGTDRYKLGLQIFALSRAMADTFSVIKIALPYMQELANLTNERVYLAIPDGREVVYLEATYPAETVNLMRSILGERAQMHCTGIGKAMLAYMDPDQIDAYLASDLQPFTDNTITDPMQLTAELEATRQRGYAIDEMEHEFGIKCVAMPILTRDKKVHAAISVSGAAMQFTDEKIVDWALLLKKYTAKIEGRL